MTDQCGLADLPRPRDGDEESLGLPESFRESGRLGADERGRRFTQDIE